MALELFYLRFNNYYNRQVKRLENVEAYRPYLIGSRTVESFNPNDGVATILTLGGATLWDGDIPDYLVVSDDGVNVISRWFILEARRKRKGQYELLLRRDLVADFFDEILTAPTFIDKATPLNANDPAVFNRELMTFNQIKTREWLLKDESLTPWIVAYLPLDIEDQTLNISGPPAVDVSVEALEDWDGYSIIGQPVYVGLGAYTFTVYGEAGQGQEVKAFNFGETLGYSDVVPPHSISFIYPPGTAEQAWWAIQEAFRPEKAAAVAAAPNYLPSNYYSRAPLIEGYVIKAADKYYRVTRSTLDVDVTVSGNVSASSALGLILNSVINTAESSGRISSPAGFAGGEVTDHCNYYVYNLEDITDSLNTTININAADRYGNDQPYFIAAMPYNDGVVINKNGQPLFTSSKELAVNVARELSKVSANVYDVQILPYCPVRYLIQDDGLDILDNKYTAIKNANDETIGAIFYAQSSSFRFDIDLSIPVGDTILDKKLSNELDVYRIVSPNYNGIFDFSPAMNNGVSRFEVNCTYKPINPLIHVNPAFKAYYGADFNDARGLICGGDFSLPQVSDAWATYQYANKNYQIAFDRETESLTLRNRIAAARDLSSTIKGVAGTFIGGSKGATFAGIATDTSSVMDAATNAILRRDAMDLREDQFSYALGNIQALNQSLTKVGSLDVNNKLWPFVEYYTATDIERQALMDKLKYNGYTVKRIGLIRDFIKSEPSFIQGRPIRFEAIADDWHLVNEISIELQKGIYI